MCCVFIRNVQHHIETVILNAARKEILVFHNHEQLHVGSDKLALLRQKNVGSGLDPNCLALKFRYC